MSDSDGFRLRDLMCLCGRSNHISANQNNNDHAPYQAPLKKVTPYKEKDTPTNVEATVVNSETTPSNGEATVQISETTPPNVEATPTNGEAKPNGSGPGPSSGVGHTITMASSRELYNFLLEAELEHYHNALRNELKITASHQIKYVKEEDLSGIGMSKPEMRRLKKYYKKEYPQGIERIYRAIKKTSDSSTNRTLSPPPLDHRLSRPTYMRGPGKQIIPSECLAIHKTLGEGEFGVVQQGIWTTEDGERVQVAIKCLSKERMLSAMADFLKEAGIMQSIDHDHMVRMFGVVLDKENTLMLVTELAPMRSLLECLKEPSLRLDFPIPRLCDFAQQICDGMSYLESKRFIHRDLAARNVLVFSKNQVKVSDFGLSRALGVGKDYYQTKFTSTLKLPIAWCAPESITYLKFTSHSDSWSYAVTLWEMFTYGFQPWAGLTGQQILETIDRPNCQRLDKPDLCPKEFFDLMLKCWEHEPVDRPSFSQLFLKLPQIRPMLVKAVKDYPSPIVQKEYLFYKAYDVVIVLDKNPDNAPEFGLWKGVLNTGKSGYFDPTNTVPFLEPKSSPIERQKPSIVRRESARKSGRRLRLDMIGKPCDDLRHTGHIGYDGAIFGDVSFIGDNVDKLPVKHGSAGSPGDDTRTSSISLPRFADSPERQYAVRNSQSEHSLGSDANGIGPSWMSKESLDSRMTIDTNRDGQKTPPYQDIDDDLDNFKFPDLSTSLDLGPSFMDEVFKALLKHDSDNDGDDEPPTPTPATTKPPLPSTPPSKPPAIAPKPWQEPRPVVAHRQELQATISLPRQQEVKSSSFLREERQSASKESTPPPLPSQPPRVDTKRDMKTEVTKKQAKVKPLSAADERMINEAMSMATDIDTQFTSSHMDSPPVHQTVPIWCDTPVAESNNEPESPSVISRIKHSLKRSSEKNDRQRTFSEEFENKSEINEELPPESQEAYNILVVRGSDKDRDTQPDEQYSTTKKFGGVELKPVSRILNGSRTSELNGNKASENDSRISEPYSVRMSETYSSRTTEPYSTRTAGVVSVGSRISDNSSKISEPIARIQTPVRKAAEPVSPVEPGSRIPEPITRIPPEPSTRIPEPTTRIPEPSSRIPELSSRSFSDRSTKPVPRARTEIRKPLEPPPPRPRPEVLRVEPTVRSTNAGGGGASDPHRFLKAAGKPPKAEVEDLTDSSDSDIKKNSQDPSSRSSSSSVERDVETGKSTEKREQRSLFDEEFSEPSAREIMSRLRESKMKRSIDHPTEEPPTPPRNLREPQGIPGRKGSSASTNEEDEEQDTNPLRMLRGGALPIRGSRSGIGNDDLTIPARKPILPLRQRRLASESSAPIGPFRRPPKRPTRSLSYDPSESPPPPVPPRRSSSFEQSLPIEPLPVLPPRRPVKQLSVNSKPRERVHPLISVTKSPPVLSPRSSLSSPIVRSPRTSVKSPPTPRSSFSAPLKALWDPYADLPPAPPLPLNSAEEAELDSDDDDDNVFLPASPQKPEPDKTWRHSGVSTFPRRKFRLNNVKYNLEDLGFYDTDDPFWVQKVKLSTHERNCYPVNNNVNRDDSIPSYTTSDNVSYEDLLEFALDREKNCEEVETMRKVFDNEVTVEDCQKALEDTHWDVYTAIKYIKLKQLLSLQLGDIRICKAVLMRNDWSVQRAVDFLLSRPPQSPEVICV